MYFLPGNRIELLTNGKEYFPALIAAIDAAAVEVHLETYIFEDDSAGRQVVDALIRAAQRKVSVRVMVDGFGARNFMPSFGERLTAAGVEVLVYRPEVARFRLRRHRLRRMHRKLASIDARIAFVGGINIIDDMNTPGHTPPRHDYAVRIEGPLLAKVHASMSWLWSLVSWVTFRQHVQPQRLCAPVTNVRGNVTAAFLIRDNLRHRYDIENAYLAAINAAQREVLIASAYFLPGRRFRQALMAAAARGVRVTLLLQGRVEYTLLHYATQALYDTLLAAGIRIYEYRRGFLHAKVAVIDGDWATVGSSNIDPFSLLLAREANVVIRNALFAGELHDNLQQIMDTGASEICDDCWNNQPLFQRLANRLAYSLVRLMIELLGYGDEH
ncbi:cardiolipin synthase ClsB [Sterolibacterium denitrificans]|nr:cardiolipin synthase ClsB [Sterolibacterium denitrificans]